MKTATATATAPVTTDPTKLQKIINNTGVDISVCMPLTSAETENGNAIKSTNGDYVLLPAGGGTNTIKTGTSDTVTLDRSYIDPDTNTATYSMGYDLIISDPIWLRPISNIGIAQDYDDNNVSFYDDVTLKALTSPTAMDQTVSFYQTIAAYPDSPLANKYSTAMKNLGQAQEDNTNVNTAEQAVVDFFASTISFKEVTMATIVALEGYYDRFPFVWANFADTATYYLYSSDGSTTSFVGSLSMSKTGAIDISKPNGGYNISFSPAVSPTDTTNVNVDGSKAKALSYESDGSFVDDADSDMPTISLKGSFQLKSTFTRDPSDTQIMVVLSGFVNGQKSAGFEKAQCTNADNTTQDWLDSLFHPKTAAQIFASVMTILGAVMMFHFIATTMWGIGKWIRQKAGGKSPVTNEQIKEQLSKVQEELKSAKAETLKKVSNNTEELSDTTTDAQVKAAGAKDVLQTNARSGVNETSLINHKNTLKNAETYADQDTTGDFQKAIDAEAGKVRSLYTELQAAKGEVATLKQQLDSMKSDMDTLNAKMKTLTDTEATVVGDNQSTTVAADKASVKSTTEDIDNNNEVTDNETAESTKAEPAEVDPIIPEV